MTELEKIMCKNVRTIMKADLVLAIDNDGDTHIIKNRWGKQSYVPEGKTVSEVISLKQMEDVDLKIESKTILSGKQRWAKKPWWKKLFLSLIGKGKGYGELKDKWTVEQEQTLSVVCGADALENTLEKKTVAGLKDE